MLINNKIIAVLTINDSTKSLDLIKCLKNVGISNLDIRLRTNESKKAIETIVNSNYDFNIGVGTVVSADDLAFINSLKIKYAFSPHTDEKIIRLSNKYNIEFIPGVSTLSDINSSSLIDSLFPILKILWGHQLESGRGFFLSNFLSMLGGFWINLSIESITSSI